MNRLTGFDHPAWVAGGATAAGYLLGLTALFLALFVLPFLLFLLA